MGRGVRFACGEAPFHGLRGTGRFDRRLAPLFLRIIDGVLKKLDASRDDLLNIGLGLPAPITNENVVLSSAILPGWVGVNAKTEVEARLGRPAHIENDANLGALAEHRHGAGVGHADMVYVKVSSGVGAGMILRGELFRGANGTAGEIGHLTIDE